MTTDTERLAELESRVEELEHERQAHAPGPAPTTDEARAEVARVQERIEALKRKPKSDPSAAGELVRAQNALAVANARLEASIYSDFERKRNPAPSEREPVRIHAPRIREDPLALRGAGV
jgi:hypothetical protein